jgi:hypothetical protein
MAKIVNKATASFQFKIPKGESNLEAHKTWFKYLTSDQFYTDVAAAYTVGATQQQIQKSARQVIEDEVYSKNTTDGTGRIKESFKVQQIDPSGSGIAALVLYSDPSVATAEAMRDGNNEGYSYAAFFEKPEFDSFIRSPDGDELHPIRHRPFFEKMVNATQIVAMERAKHAYARTISSHKPKRGN